MSKELEAINAYIDHQQNKINELVQEVMMLETRNNILIKDVEELKNINKKYEDEIDAMSFHRDGVSTLVTDSNFKTRNETIDNLAPNNFDDNKTRVSGHDFTKMTMLRRD